MLRSADICDFRSTTPLERQKRFCTVVTVGHIQAFCFTDWAFYGNHGRNAAQSTLDLDISIECFIRIDLSALVRFVAIYDHGYEDRFKGK